MTSATNLMLGSSPFQLESSLRAEMSGDCAETAPVKSIATKKIAPPHVLAPFTRLGYRPLMPDVDKLTPADPSDLAAALAFALRYQGRKRVHNVRSWPRSSRSGLWSIWSARASLS
jgi:hypothetical protein